MPTVLASEASFCAGVTAPDSLSLSLFGQPSRACVWYPSPRATPERPLLYAKVLRGRAAVAAPLAAVVPTALCVLVHGLRGTLYDLAWLGERLARAGLVALAFEQPGVSFRTYAPEVAPRAWARAALVAAAIDALGAEPRFGPLVAGRPVVLAGHSAGASAAFVLAGAQVDAARFAARYAHAGPVPPPAPPDARVRAVLGLAPGSGEIFSDAGLAAMPLPCVLFSGGRDLACPDRFNAARYAAHMPRAVWHRLPKAGHFAFKPCCSWYGKLRAPATCLDAWGVSRAALHEQVAAAWLAALTGPAGVLAGRPSP